MIVCYLCGVLKRALKQVINVHLIKFKISVFLFLNKSMNVFSIYFIIKVFHLLDIKIPRMIFKHEKSIIK